MKNTTTRRTSTPSGKQRTGKRVITICHQAVRWELIDVNPFVGLIQNKGEVETRTVTRSQIVRFYLCSLKQARPFRTMGCAAMFCYLTGFRAPINAVWSALSAELLVKP